MIWKNINKFEDYFISCKGDVLSLKGLKPRLLKKLNPSSGYISYTLKNASSSVQILAHRLVAEAFIDNPGNKLCVNHKDGNKQNNHVSNLEWCTNAENSQHAFKTGLSKVKLNYNQVLEIRELLAEGGTRVSWLAKKYNVSRQTISDIKRNVSWKI